MAQRLAHLVDVVDSCVVDVCVGVQSAPHGRRGDDIGAVVDRAVQRRVPFAGTLTAERQHHRVGDRQQGGCIVGRQKAGEGRLAGPWRRASARFELVLVIEMIGVASDDDVVDGRVGHVEEEIDALVPVQEAEEDQQSRLPPYVMLAQRRVLFGAKARARDRGCVGDELHSRPRHEWLKPAVQQVDVAGPHDHDLARDDDLDQEL